MGRVEIWEGSKARWTAQGGLRRGRAATQGRRWHGDGSNARRTKRREGNSTERTAGDGGNVRWMAWGG